MNIFNLTDIIVSLFYIFIILTWAYLHGAIKVQDNSSYRFFFWGLFAKIIGVVFFCSVYYFYYNKGGDTFDYFHDAVNIEKLIFKYPKMGFSVLFGNDSSRQIYDFTIIKNLEFSNYFNPSTFAVSRYIVVLCILTLNSFLAASILLSFISYIVIWKFYMLLTEYYSKIKLELAFACLFIPSVLFWGSGLMKDTFTHAATLGSFYCLFRIFITKTRVIYFSLLTIIFVNIVIVIKPYIFFPFILALIVSFLFYHFHKIKSFFIKLFLLPVFLFFIIYFANEVVNSSSSILGNNFKNSEALIDGILNFQKGMKTAGNTGYDLGYIESSIPGLLQKFPKAVFTGLNRPMLWEAQNSLMLVSSIENLAFLGLLFFTLFFVGPINIFLLFWKNQLLMSLLIFSITFAFFVGLTSANFGALVRFKIPLVPFFISALVILIFHRMRQLEEC